MANNNKRTAPGIARLASVTLVTVLALTLAASTTALAEPEFHPIGGTFTGLGLGPEEIEFAGNTIKCTHNTLSGTVSSATLVGGVVIVFTGCTSSSATKTGCPALTVGALSGTIATNTLHGVLGLILPKGTGTGVGLLLLPVANKKWGTLEANACTSGTTFSGNLAAEVKPVGGGLVLSGLLLFQAAAGGGESIKDFDLSTGGLVRPEWEWFGAEASLAALEDLMFTPNVEVS